MTLPPMILPPMHSPSINVAPMNAAPDDCSTTWVGVIPSAGRATRLSPLPCSKELLPVGFERRASSGLLRPKVVSSYLIDRMRLGGMRRLFIVARPEKDDLPRYYGDGAGIGVPVAYLQAGAPWGPGFTVAQAVPFLGEACVMFGFPDILIDPADSYGPAARRLEGGRADVVLGLFDCTADVAGDWVECDEGGRVTSLQTRESQPLRPPRHLCWMFAVWRPTFSRFLVDTCRGLDAQARAQVRASPAAPWPEWPMGALFTAALQSGLTIESVRFPGGRFLDVGTPDNLARAVDFPGVWDGRD